MDFFGIGPMEILLVLVVALIIFGPGKLPEIARTLGKATRVLKKATFDLTAQVSKELEEEKSPAADQTQKRSAQTGASAEPHK